MAPTDPRFLQMTPEDIEAEYWAYYYEKNSHQEEYEDDDFDDVMDEFDSDDFNEDDWESLVDDH